VIWRGTILEDEAGTFFLNIVRERSQIFIWVTMLSSDIKLNQYMADVHIGKGDDFREAKVSQLNKRVIVNVYDMNWVNNLIQCGEY